MKRFFGMVVGLFILVFCVFNTYSCDEEIFMRYNNKPVKFNNDFPFIYEDRMFLGLRNTCETFGLKVWWDDTSNTAYISTEDRQMVVRITAWSNMAYVNDELIILPKEAMIIDGRMFVPLRFISETFKKQITYSDDTRTVFISNK